MASPLQVQAAAIVAMTHVLGPQPLTYSLAPCCCGVDSIRKLVCVSSSSSGQGWKSAPFNRCRLVIAVFVLVLNFSV